MSTEQNPYGPAALKLLEQLEEQRRQEKHVRFMVLWWPLAALLVAVAFLAGVILAVRFLIWLVQTLRVIA